MPRDVRTDAPSIIDDPRAGQTSPLAPSAPAVQADSAVRAAGSIELSAVVPAQGVQGQALRQVVAEYREALAATGYVFELLVVVDGRDPDLVREVRQIPRDGMLRVIVLGKWPGDATALSIGFAHSSGSLLLTLPAYHQVAVEALPTLIEALEEQDMLVVRRWPRTDGAFKRLQTRAFALFLRTSLRLPFRDLGCGVRLLRREVADTIYIYGDQQRFLPVLAERYGYRVAEVDLPQAPPSAGGPHSTFPLGSYVRRLLDLLSIFFLVNYTIKPLRFFGLTGLFTFLFGGFFTLYLTAERFIGGVPMADRPALLLGLLLIVLGVQLFAIGLIGELIIYIHARNLKTYTIEQLIGFEEETMPSD